MDHLYERIVNLLGKPAPYCHELFRELKKVLMEEPIIQSPNTPYSFYDFPQSGISLDFDGNKSMFISLTLFLQIDENESSRPYCGNLPFGITKDDISAIVEKKLPGCTSSVKDYRYDRDLRPLTLQCHFKDGSDSLSFISVDYKAED